MGSSLFGNNSSSTNPTSQPKQSSDNGLMQKIGQFLGYIEGKDPEKLLNDFIVQNGVSREEYNDAMEKAKKYAPLVEMFLRSRK